MNPEDLLIARLERLEASVAHLERLTDQLNEALVEQGRQVLRIQKRMDLITETLSTRAEPAGSSPVERPPHYGR